MKDKARILLVLMLLFSSVSFAADECYICDLMAGKPQSQLLLTANTIDNEITAYLFYENFTAEPPRQAIDDSLLFVYVVPAEGDTELLKFFTDDEGRATFDFSDFAEHARDEQIIYNFQVIYCPFCHPEDEGYPCGFDECVAFSGMEVPPSISGAENPVDMVPLADGASLLPEDQWNREYYLPTSATFTYTPPPPIVPEVPAFCFPIILIFALLAGAMYYTGKNPFAGFDVGTPRMGRHIRYTPGGRGMSVSGRYVAQSIAGGVSEAKSMVKEAKAEKKETAGMSKAELKSYKAEKKEARKEAAKNQFLNFVSLGTYGTITGASGRVAAGPKGGFEVASGRGAITAIKKAPAVIAQAKKTYKAGKIAMKPATIEGVGVKGKGYGAQVVEQAVRAGGGIISSNIFGSAVGGMMMGFVLKKDITALSQQQADIEIAKEESRKLANTLDKLVQDEKLTEITVDNRTYYEMDKTVEAKDGKVTVITTRIDKQALLDGKLEGTVAIGKENYVEVRHFTGEYGINPQTGQSGLVTNLTSITITKGSGAETVSAVYSIAGGRLKMDAITFGEDGRGRPVTSGENLEFVKNLDGRPLDQAVTTEFLNTKIGAGETIGKISGGLAESNFKKIDATDRKEEVMKTIALHSYYKTNEELKDYSRQTAETIDAKMSKAKLSDEGTLLLARGKPVAGENAKEHYEAIADKAVVQEGSQAVVEQYKGEATKAQSAGAAVVYSMGTDLATKSEGTVRGEIRSGIMKMDDLSREEKNEAMRAANEMYSGAKKSAEKWDKAVNEAATTYNAVYEITKKNMSPLYKGKDKDVGESIVQGAANAGITGYFGSKAETTTKKDKHTYMQDEIAKATISGSKGILDETPEQKFLTKYITKGSYQEPAIPEMPKPPEFKRENVGDENAMKGYYEKLQGYSREMDYYNKQMRQWEGKQQNLVYGDGANTALGGALVLTSAIQKGYKLPDEVYDNASQAIDSADPGKWKESAVKAMEEVEKQKDEKREKEIKSLKGQKELGL